MRATCRAAIFAGTLTFILTPGMGTTLARAQQPGSTPAARTTRPVVPRDPTTMRASTPATSSYWGPKPATAPANSKPSAWQRFKNRFTSSGSKSQGGETPVYHDPTTGRDNLPLAKPWMAQGR